MIMTHLKSKNITMANNNILEQILSNTEEVKEVVVTRENEKQQRIDLKEAKRKEQLRESQKKFKQIKANVKPELYDRIKNKCADGNVSGYLLKLIENDFSNTPSLFGSYLEVPDENSQESKELESLRLEVKELNNMNFFQKLRWLFKI
jgi:hypothetical protein